VYADYEKGLPSMAMTIAT